MTIIICESALSINRLLRRSAHRGILDCLKDSDSEKKKKVAWLGIYLNEYYRRLLVYMRVIIITLESKLYILGKLFQQNLKEKSEGGKKKVFDRIHFLLQIAGACSISARITTAIQKPPCQLMRPAQKLIETAAQRRKIRVNIKDLIYIYTQLWFPSSTSFWSL